MFEKELERAKKQLKQQLATQDPYVTLQSIKGNGAIHPAYRTYFGAEVAWWIHEERAIRNSNPRFDTRDASFRELFSKVDEAYARTARFDHEELNAVIDGAVKTRMNFLCRPRTTLKWFVFRGEPTKTLNEVLLRLAFVHDHEYLTDGIRHLASSRTVDGTQSFEILSIVEFERIVEKVDNDHILDLSQNEFVRLLDPLFDFFAEVNTDLPPEAIPTEAVIIFLDDKGAIPISQALERLLYREELKLLTRSKFLDVVDQVIAEIDFVDPGPKAQDPEPKVQEPEPKAQDPETNAQEPGPQEVIGSTYEVRYRAYERDTSAEQRAKFLEKLFRGDKIEMESVVGQVLGSETWKIAAVRLDRWFMTSGVKADSATAMELTHALNRAFR
jgi:hypothetical protein